MPEKQPLWKTFTAGGVGGACLVAVGHPLDTVKVRIQTMKVEPGKTPPYSGAIDCFRKTLAKEGIRGLYAGVGAPFAATVPMYALCFFGYGIGQKIFLKENSMEELDLIRIGAAGATSGLFTTPILAPMERVKCVLQVQGATDGPKKYSGPADCFKKLYAEGGIASVNRGFFGTMLRDSIASWFYFGSYEFLKFHLTPKGEKSPSMLGTLFAGGIAGIFNWAFAIPVDTLKTRVQVAPEGKYPNGLRSAFKELITKENPLALYRGFSAVMLRAFPANAACFLGYESCLKFIAYLGM